MGSKKIVLDNGKLDAELQKSIDDYKAAARAKRAEKPAAKSLCGSPADEMQTRSASTRSNLPLATMNKVHCRSNHAYR